MAPDLTTLPPASADPPIHPIAPPSTTPSQPTHTLPSPFTDSSLTLLTQGAEALVYRTTYPTPSTPCVLKFRPLKPYRHPILDKRLTRARILAEARNLVKCAQKGVSVPGVLGLDWEAGWLCLEWIRGQTVRAVLEGWAEDRRQRQRQRAAVEQENVGHGQDEGGEEEQQGGAVGGDEDVKDLLRRIGRAIGKLHDAGVVHGDLTTSNIMLRPPPAPSEPHSSFTRTMTGDIVLIDFGLASQNIGDEDKAVDLYVLERAFGATHPLIEPFFGAVLEAYGTSGKAAKAVLRKLEDVRMRGRKKSMVG